MKKNIFISFLCGMVIGLCAAMQIPLWKSLIEYKKLKAERGDE